MHFNLLSVLLKALSYLDVSWDDYVERGIKEEVRGNYDEISTESSDKLEQTDEQIALNREQLGETLFYLQKKITKKWFVFLASKIYAIIHVDDVLKNSYNI